jgi:hypothetical protein
MKYGNTSSQDCIQMPTNFIPYVNLVYSGAEGDKKSLVIFFDKRRVVQQYTINTSKVDVSQGLIPR